MDGIVTPGFSQARGTITGHIAFGSGTAVQGVRVSLVKSSADQESDQVQYLSRYIEGAGKGLQWTADSANYAAVFTGQQPATLQLWAKPASDGGEQMALATLTNALQVGVKKGDIITEETMEKTFDVNPTLTTDDGTDLSVWDTLGQLVDGDINNYWLSKKNSDSKKWYPYVPAAGNDVIPCMKG